MTDALAADFPADDFNQPDEPWFIEAKDKDSAPEFNRQMLFLSRLHNAGAGG
jgi:hypothetical protein